MLLPMDAARLLIRLVLQVGALAAGHHAVGFGATLDPVQMHLAGGEAARLAHGQLTVLHAIRDALTLILLAGVIPGRVGERGTRNHDGQGREHD